MGTELSRTYDPAAVELEANRVWMEEKCFAADPARPGEPYCIVIPPPNVTGALHLGHAINCTLQDILIRVHRMRGFNTLWIPGVDHAGIATQAVVEKQLKEKENKTRHDVGREELVSRIWAWKEQYGNRIVEQLKRLGCSCDWDRTRFTLDDMCARAVRETFFKLFKDGLIYRGKRLVNWDTHLQTSISDDEIYHETVKTSLWHLRYPIIEDGFTAKDAKNAKEEMDPEFLASFAPFAVNSPDSRPKYLTIATTRPETLLGDTAVAVHSQDPRWNWAIGKFVALPLTGRRIPIIADDILVDPTFGSGVVKVTPAHDPNDYAVWQRHLGQSDEIGIINILNPNGTINENGGAYAGMKREAARKKVVEDLAALGLLEKEEPYETQVGHSDRSKTPIEPYLSDQWFVKMAPLAEPALEVVRNGTIKFFPERHAQQYLSWLGEKRDWPISRQLWWGHRIPVWTRKLSGPELAAIAVGEQRHIAKKTLREEFSFLSDADFARIRVEPRGIERYACVGHGLDTIEKELEANGFTQDPDVLDTWFSSALWPHSTLGWPGQTADLVKWYPTSVLVTGRDIITLWVARMVMAGMYNMGHAILPSPSPGNPGEGRGGRHVLPFEPAQFGKETTFVSDGAASQYEGFPSSQSSALSPQSSASDPHPNPLPEYRARGKDLGIPFFHVAINPTILDGKGERMSKSKGNGVDPVDIIDAHGADALRFTMTLMATETQDARLPVKKDAAGRNTSDKFDIGRNLANKLWNAARFALSGLESSPQSSVLSPQSLVDRWIISRFNRAVSEADAALADYRFDQYAKICYDFFWRDFCDWFVEAIKPALKDAAKAAQSSNVLAAVLDGTLRLLHPMTPFITETIWWRLNEVRPQRGLSGLLECPPSMRLIHAAWPKAGAFDETAESEFHTVQEIVGAIRNVRNNYKIDPRRILVVYAQDADGDVLKNSALINLLVCCELKQAADWNSLTSRDIPRVTVAGREFWIDGLFDKGLEKERTEKQRGDWARKIATLSARMADPGYIAKAPPRLVEETKRQLAEAEAELAKLG